MAKQRILPDNILLDTDSYKPSHWKQMPPGTTNVYAYAEARTGGRFNEVTFFGLQYYLSRYLEGQVVTSEAVQEAKALCDEHLGPDVFNEVGAQRLVDVHGGVWPVEICALPEGTVVPEGTVLFTVETTSDDPLDNWTPGYIEAALVRNWYPTTVATNSREAKKLILSYLQETGDPALIDYKLHDFGARGVSSKESAQIGGAAHLLNFKGSDTMDSIRWIRNYYITKAMPAHSIPAMEHGTITSWKKTREAESYKNMLERYPTGPVAIVSDSYDLYNAIQNIHGGVLKDQIMGRNGFLVVRPDSGDPVQIVGEVVSLLFNKFGGTVNAKGFKVLDPHVRVIQGDGITNASIPPILDNLCHKLRFSADNVAFGMGGGLLQHVNRDDQRYAYKVSEVITEGEHVPVFKQPATDPTKKSKSGRFAVIEDINGNIKTVPLTPESAINNILRPVFRNGKILREYTWEEAVANANKWMVPKPTGGKYFTR